MKKILRNILLIALGIIALVAIAGMYKFNYLANQPGYDVDGNKIKTLHPTWDVDNDGINDCEKEGLCDHTVDYSQARFEE